MRPASAEALDGDPFGASRAPANRAPNPAFEASLRAVLGRVVGGEPLILLVGDAGLGKTLLLGAIEAALGVRGRVKRVARGELMAAELGTADLLLVDEGDRAEASLVARVAAREWRGTVVLACARDPLAGLASERRSAAQVLRAMTPRETRRFARAHLARFGQQALLTRAGIDALADASGGNPRALLQIGGGAVFLARGDGRTAADAPDVRAATAMRSPLRSGPASTAVSRNRQAAASAPVRSPTRTAARARWLSANASAHRAIGRPDVRSGFAVAAGAAALVAAVTVIGPGVFDRSVFGQTTTHRPTTRPSMMQRIGTASVDTDRPAARAIHALPPQAMLAARSTGAIGEIERRVPGGDSGDSARAMAVARAPVREQAIAHLVSLERDTGPLAIAELAQTSSAGSVKRHAASGDARSFVDRTSAVARVEVPAHPAMSSPPSIRGAGSTSSERPVVLAAVTLPSLPMRRPATETAVIGTPTAATPDIADGATNTEEVRAAAIKARDAMREMRVTRGE